MTGPQHPKNSPFIAHWLIFGVAALFLGTFIAWNIYQEYTGIDTAERERLSARAKIIDENMMRQLDATNRMLGGIRNDLPYLDKRKDGLERFIHRLKFLIEAMPGVRFIAVLDAQGRIIAANQEEFIGQDFRHRDYFQAPQRDPNPDMLYVSPPFRNVSGIITMGLSRAIVAPDGRFAGVVMASLEPEEFRILMNSVRYAPDVQASLIHGGGVVFMGIPEQEGLVGMDMAAKPDSLFNRHIKSGQAASVISGMVTAAGEERMMALRTSQPAALRMNKPMVIAISRDLPAVFAGWRRETWQLGGLFCALTLISGAGLFAYQRRQRDYNRLVASHEAERHKAAERLKLATEAAGIGVWEYDLVSETLFWDDSMFAIYGMAPEKFSADYMTWRNSLLPEDVAETEAATRPAIEQGKPYDICFRIRRGDGQVRTIRALAQVNFDESGKAVRMVGINEDITERKQVEDALANSENRFREIFNTVSDAIFIHDAETGRILDVNRRMLEMYGLSREQALVCGPDDLSAGVPPYSSAEAIKKIRLAQSAGPQTFDWLARARDGRFFWVEVSLRFASIGGEQRILAVVRDISERKHVDAELRIAAIAFESQDGTVVTNADSVILRVNRAFTEITGYTAEEAIGQTPRLLRSGLHDKAFYAAMWENILHDGSWHGEIWNRRKNGEIYPERLTITAVKGNAGETTNYVATLRDITEQKRVEEALQESEALLQATMKILPVGLWIMNAEGKIVFGNTVGQQIWAGARYVGVEQFGEYKGWWLDSGKRIEPHEWSAARAIEKGEISIEEEIEIECFDGTHKIILNSSLPLRRSDGSISGAIIVNQDITERKQAEEQIRHLAFYDTLTQLPNRRLLNDRIGQVMAASKRSGNYGALMFLDLDNFKPLNDTHGHDVGDLLLVEVAHRIASCVREVDTVARFGGDEFVVMLSELDADKDESAAQAGTVAEKIRATLAEPYSLTFKQEGDAEVTVVHHCTSSIGVALFINHEAGPEDVLKWADIAMYQAKEGGRNRVHFYGA